jgi:hypothetical protein
MVNEAELTYAVRLVLQYDTNNLTPKATLLGETPESMLRTAFIESIADSSGVPIDELRRLVRKTYEALFTHVDPTVDDGPEPGTPAAIREELHRAFDILIDRFPGGWDSFKFLGDFELSLMGLSAIESDCGPAVQYGPALMVRYGSQVNFVLDRNHQLPGYGVEGGATYTEITTENRSGDEVFLHSESHSF